MTNGDNVLFEPFTLGDLELPNRIIMAPLTRARASQPGDVPSDMNARYYAQRASAGLIMSEATQVSQQGQGYAYTPGIYTPEQIAGWRRVTNAVQAAGGRMHLQLWHVGRISRPELQPHGDTPVAPSAIKPNAQTFISAESGMVAVLEPRALAADELPGVVEQFRVLGDLRGGVLRADLELLALEVVALDNHRLFDVGGEILRGRRFVVNLSHVS